MSIHLLPVIGCTGKGSCYGCTEGLVWVYMSRSDGETALMWTIVGSRGRIQGLAGQSLLTHWDQRWDCFHWKEFQEWARRAISDFTRRAPTTVSVQRQAHTLSPHIRRYCVPCQQWCARHTPFPPPMSPSTRRLSLRSQLTSLQSERCHLTASRVEKNICFAQRGEGGTA